LELCQREINSGEAGTADGGPATFSRTTMATTEEMDLRMEDAMLPPDFYLDESDPDIITLRRKDGTFVAAFSAQGATREGIVQAALQDSRNPKVPGSSGEGEDP
jgi:hypothetical protein